MQANAVLDSKPNDPSVHALLSAIASRQGKKDLALVEIHRALQLDPNRAAFHEDLALLQADDRAKGPIVEDELKKAVALDPKSLNAKVLLASLYSRNSRLQDAERVGWEAVATSPGSIAARENVATIILEEGDQARAEQVLRQASKDLAANPQGLLLLADYFSGSGQLDKAIAELASLTTKYPDNSFVKKQYIRVLLQARDYSTARTVIAGLIRRNHRDPEVAELNGIVLLEDGKASEAVTALQNSSGAFPNDASIQNWLGKAALASADFNLAERSFRRAVELNPREVDAQEELARIARQRGDMGLLADLAETTIAAMPNFPGGYVSRAIVEMDRNLSADAEADLKTAINLAPQQSPAYLQLGILRFKQRRFSEGTIFLERALQDNPDSIAAMRLLVSYDLYRKRPEAAIARLNSQIEKSPGSSSIYDLLADVQIQTGKLDQADASVKKALQLNPGDGNAVMLFAQIAAQRGQIDIAVADWEKKSIAQPNDAGALAILGTLEESRGRFGQG